MHKMNTPVLLYLAKIKSIPFSNPHPSLSAICIICEILDHNMRQSLPLIFLHNESYPCITNFSKSDNKLVLRMRKSTFCFSLYSLFARHYFNTDRSKAVHLLWFLTVTCSCCPYLYIGSAIMLVTYFSKF